jgi:hypothetical protein
MDRRLLAASARVTTAGRGKRRRAPIMTLYMARDYVPPGPDIDYVDDDMLIESMIPGIR